MSAPISPQELAAFAAMKRAVVALRLGLGAHLRDRAGISLIQFEILFLLDQSSEGLRMHRIADAVGLSRGGLTYQVSQLEEAGWVRRVAAASNARAVVAEITAAGRERIGAVNDEHMAFVRSRFLDRLSADELSLVTGVFLRIAEDAGAPEADA